MQKEFKKVSQVLELREALSFFKLLSGKKYSLTDVRHIGKFKAADPVYTDHPVLGRVEKLAANPDRKNSFLGLSFSSTTEFARLDKFLAHFYRDYTRPFIVHDRKSDDVYIDLEEMSKRVNELHFLGNWKAIQGQRSLLGVLPGLLKRAGYGLNIVSENQVSEYRTKKLSLRKLVNAATGPVEAVERSLNAGRYSFENYFSKTPDGKWCIDLAGLEPHVKTLEKIRDYYAIESGTESKAEIASLGKKLGISKQVVSALEPKI
jgi:hypothetical protein